MHQRTPKWLYRLESTDPNLGLWYNAKGEWVMDETLGKLPDNETKNLPMDYDWRYKQDGKDWWSACSNKEDLTHWYSIDDARTLIDQGFRFSKYLATEYHEYELETVFRKETCLARQTLSLEDVFDLTEQKGKTHE